MSDIAALRLRAFSAKLALKRLGGFYARLKTAALADGLPESHEVAATPGLQQTLSEFSDVHRRTETMLFEEVRRLAIEAEEAANLYARMEYGFGPGEVVKVQHPSGGPVRLRVTKIFLQSGSDSDIRVEAASLRPDGTVIDTWDLYFAAPGKFQADRTRRRAPPAH
jgi:hypothetical protein